MKAIIIMAKIKSLHRLTGTQKHNNREQETPNSDRGKGHLNELIFGREDIAKAVKEKLTEVQKDMTKAIRKDAVIAQEYILNASPEFFFDLDKKTEQRWIEENTKFMTDMYGEENVVNITAHRDEDHLHLHAVIVPVYKNGKGKKRLSAKHYTGGSSGRLRQLQTDYANAMSGFGLERGKEGSQVEYKDLQQYKEETAEQAGRIREIMNNPGQTAINIVNAQRLAKQLQEENKRLKAQVALLEDSKNRQNRQAKEKANKQKKQTDKENKQIRELFQKIADRHVTLSELQIALKQTSEQTNRQTTKDLEQAIQTQKTLSTRRTNKQKSRGK